MIATASLSRHDLVALRAEVDAAIAEVTKISPLTPKSKSKHKKGK